RPDLLQQLAKSLAVAEPAHRAKHRPARMLEREVKVRSYARCSCQNLDQAWPDLGWLQIADSDPADPRHRGKLWQQRLQQPEVPEVLAIRRGILAHKNQFPGAVIGEPARFSKKIVGSARDECPAESGDRAECASPVAS